MDVQQNLSTWTRVGKRKNKATVWVMRHYFPIAFQNSSWLRTEASLAKARLQCSPRSSGEQSPGSFRLPERFQSWLWLSRSLCKQLYPTALEAIGDWQTGAANVAYIWNKFQVFKNNVMERVCKELKLGLTKQNRIQGLLETYGVSLGIRKQPSCQSPKVSASNTAQCVCIPIRGHSGILPSGCWKCRDIPVRKLRILLTSTKSQSFLSTWPLAFPCRVMWNSSNHCLQNWTCKVKCHGADYVFSSHENL